MAKDTIDIADLESFINGLKDSFDTLGSLDQSKAKGFQAQLAKAISDLRLKRTAKIEPIPKHIGHFSEKDLKKMLLQELETLKDHLNSSDYNRRRKFELVMKLTRLRDQINHM